MFAGGILWIVALLANMLGAEALFQSDYDDGSLDQLLIAEQPLYFLVMPYLLVQWLLSGLVLALLSPLFALMLGLPQQGIAVLMASLALGSGVMSVLGAIGAALTVGLRRGGMLIALLITPFYVPVLIFGAGAVRAAVDGLAFAPYLALLGAMFSLALALGPVAIAAALRISADA
jgi:heme exporter protein B